MATTNIPRISLCVAMYNVAQYLPRFVESLAKQPNLEEMEFIFVNDASPDDSEAVLRSEMEKYPALKSQTRILTHSENQGISQTRQDGLDAARGTYMTWADPDDWVDPGMYQELANAADQAHADLVWEDFWFEQALSKGRTRRSQACGTTGEDLYCGCLCAGSPNGSLWKFLFRRDFLNAHKCQFLRGRISVGEDTSFLCNIFVKNPKACYIPKAHYHYRENPKSISFSTNASYFKDRYITESNICALARTDREQKAAKKLKQLLKSEVAFSERCYVPYREFSALYPEIRNLEDFECTRLRKVLFSVAVRGPVCRWLSRKVYWTIYLPYMLLKRIYRR